MDISILLGVFGARGLATCFLNLTCRLRNDKVLSTRWNRVIFGLLMIMHDLMLPYDHILRHTQSFALYSLLIFFSLPGTLVPNRCSHLLLAPE